jgi:hypothetical protein
MAQSAPSDRSERTATTPRFRQVACRNGTAAEHRPGVAKSSLVLKKFFDHAVDLRLGSAPSVEQEGGDRLRARLQVVEPGLVTTWDDLEAALPTPVGRARHLFYVVVILPRRRKPYPKALIAETAE